MAELTRAMIEHKIENGYQFKLGDYISKGFNLFSKEWVLFSVYGLVATILLLLSFLTIVGVLFIGAPLMLGFCVAAEKVDRGEPLSFSDFFGAFKNYGSYAVLGLAFILAMGLLMVPYLSFVFFMMEDPENASFAMGFMFLMTFYMFFMMILVYAMQIFLFFTPYLIHYGDFSATEAMKLSFKLTKKNFWWILLFVLIVGLISGIGQYACIVGVFASMAVGGCMNYAMVKDILLTDNFNEIEKIGVQHNS